MEQIALQVHIVTIIFLGLLVLYTDHVGLTWMRGKVGVVSKKMVRVLHHLVWLGLTLMIGSGFVMFLSYKDFLLVTPVFYAKMFFVAALIVNALVIGKCMHVATVRPFSELTSKERLPLVVSGGISTLSWIGAILCGLSLGI